MNIMYIIKHLCLGLLSIAMLSSCNYSAIRPFCRQNAIVFSIESVKMPPVLEKAKECL